MTLDTRPHKKYIYDIFRESPREEYLGTFTINVEKIMPGVPYVPGQIIFVLGHWLTSGSVDCLAPAVVTRAVRRTDSCRYVAYIRPLEPKDRCFPSLPVNSFDNTDRSGFDGWLRPG